MKGLFAISAIVLAFSQAQAFGTQTPVNCTATQVFDSSIFEESLSVEEYPSLVVKTAEEAACPMCPAFQKVVRVIKIGISRYESFNKKDHTLKIDWDSQGNTTYVVNDKVQKLEYRIDKKGNQALLTAKDRKGKVTKVAVFDCEE